MIRFSPERAVFAQDFRVEGEMDMPTQFVLQQIACAFLHKDVFRILVAHGRCWRLSKEGRRIKHHNIAHINKIALSVITTCGIFAHVGKTAFEEKTPQRGQIRVTRGQALARLRDSHTRKRP